MHGRRRDTNFNLHAGVSGPGGLPAARERLLRYCARPPLALDRLSVLDDGRICYRIKDGDQARLMTPTQFFTRLARRPGATPLVFGPTTVPAVTLLRDRAKLHR
jgi:hypothetical protein